MAIHAPDAQSTKPKPSEELELTRNLKWLMRHRTSPDALNHFLSKLNTMIRTALIKQHLDRLDGTVSDR